MKYLNLQKHKFGSKKSIIYCSFIFIFFCIFFSLTKITTEIASGLKVNELKLEIGSEQNFQNIFYEKFVFEVYKNLIENRTFENFNKGHERHKLRWSYRYLEYKWYNILFDLSNSKILSFYTLTNTIYIFLSFLFIFLTLKTNHHLTLVQSLFIPGMIFYGLFCLLITNGYQSIYTFPEVCFISMGIFFSKTKKFYLFMIPLILAVLNRESGIALSLVYIIFNHREKKAYILPIISVLALLAINFDLITNHNLYKIQNYIPINEDFGHNYSKSELIFSLVFFLNFIFVLSICLFDNTEFEIKLLSITIIFFLVRLFGTTLTDNFNLILSLPALTCLLTLKCMKFYNKKK